MSVIVELSVFPMNTGDSHLSPYVARVIDVIAQSGLSYELGPMSTSIEGEWQEVMNVVDACYHALENDSDRIYITFKADCKKGRTNGLDGKVRSVQEKLT